MPSAANQLSLAVDYLRNTVAGSSTFQTWVGETGDASAAKAHVHVVADTAFSRPMAWVEFNRWRREKIATGAFFGSGNTLRLVFQADVSGESTLDDQVFAFTNQVGQIVKDMEALAGEATYLDISSIELVDGPYLPTEAEATTRGEFVTMEFDVEFAAL